MIGQSRLWPIGQCRVGKQSGKSFKLKFLQVQNQCCYELKNAYGFKYTFKDIQINAKVLLSYIYLPGRDVFRKFDQLYLAPPIKFVWSCRRLMSRLIWVRMTSFLYSVTLEYINPFKNQTCRWFFVDPTVSLFIHIII